MQCIQCLSKCGYIPCLRDLRPLKTPFRMPRNEARFHGERWVFLFYKALGVAFSGKYTKVSILHGRFRRKTLARDIDIRILSVRLSVCLSVCPSVCPSVCHAPILYRNSSTYRALISIRCHVVVFPILNIFCEIPTGLPPKGRWLQIRYMTICGKRYKIAP